MQSWGLTDPGCVRKQNQDAYKIEQLDRGNLLCIVCDGMGGAKSGNVASTLAVEVFVEEVRRSWVPGMAAEASEQMLRSAVKLANFTVYDQSRQFEEFDGMGTTLVAALIRGRKVSVVNVGDSRAYRISQHGIRQITKDHSVVQMMVDRGELTPEVAKSYPGKNFITRALGVDAQVRADGFTVRLRPGERLLLCSDGLSNALTDETLYRLCRSGRSPEKVCRRLIQHALCGGARDNVTAALIMRW